MSPLRIQLSAASPPRGQHGATLIVALIFLVVLTMLGLSAAQNSTMEERMAGNTRNRDLAFQAAEAALNHVFRNLSTGDNIRGQTFGATNGYLIFNATAANDSGFWSSYTWNSSNANQIPVTLNLLQVNSQPWYVVERMPNVGTAEYYRATARGVGGDASAVVILQAVYKYTP